jgi:FdrA protein
MSTVLTEIRPGAYYDSIVLMQLQRTLADLPGIMDAGVVMGTPANKELLAQSHLLGEEAQAAGNEDLILVVHAGEEAAARAALAQVDEILARRRSQAGSEGYRPKSLVAALKMQPEARWALVSVPGRYAAGVAEEALGLGLNVFLYSDNVPVEDELRLKRKAQAAGLLVMGPDCGTAMVDGVGLGFANRVRRGNIGLVAASGTGLQAVTAAIHRLGGGVSQALGTGGRDLSETIGAISAGQALAQLAADPQTEVIVLISKPPAPAVADALLAQAQASGKPVVVNFIGYTGDLHTVSGTHLHLAPTLESAADLAFHLAHYPNLPISQSPPSPITQSPNHPTTHSPPYLRALYSGGTLAYEALFLLQAYLPGIQSNVPLPGGLALSNPHRSQGHTVVDLGEDEFTVGRLHPMMDNALRIRRLHEEAADPESGLILLDVVLGDGAHPDPAAELAPAITQARSTAQAAGRDLPIIAVVIGTDQDPQGMEGQMAQLHHAGARVFTRHDQAIGYVREWGVGSGDRGLGTGEWGVGSGDLGEPISQSLNLPISQSPFVAINIGLESFAESLVGQGAAVVQVDWRPPAGGNERLMGLLARMRSV